MKHPRYETPGPRQQCFQSPKVFISERSFNHVFGTNRTLKLHSPRFTHISGITVCNIYRFTVFRDNVVDAVTALYLLY